MAPQWLSKPQTPLGSLLPLDAMIWMIQANSEHYKSLEIVPSRTCNDKNIKLVKGTPLVLVINSVHEASSPHPETTGWMEPWSRILQTHSVS